MDEQLPNETPGARPSAGLSWLALLGGSVLWIVWLVSLYRIPVTEAEFAYHYPVSLRVFQPMFGFTMEQWWSHVAGWWWGVPGTALIAVGLARHMPDRWPTGAALALGSSIGSVLAMACAMLGVLRGRPVVDDELTYAFQARQFLDGRIGWDVLPMLTASSDYAEDRFLVLSRVGWVGKYYFGEPLLQMPGVWVGVPALLHLPVAALTLYAIWRAASLMYGSRVAGWAVLLTGLSPMFVFTGATGLSHLPAFCCIAIATWGVAKAREGQGDLVGLMLLGGAVGLCATFRPQVAASVGAALGLWTTWILVRRRRWPLLFVGVLACLPFVAVLLAWNVLITGDPLVLPASLQARPERYGFVLANEVTGVHTPALAGANLVVVLTRLNMWWLGWPASLVLLASGLPWLLEKERRIVPGRRLLPWIGMTLAIVAFNFGYYSPGISDTGPVYYFELLLPGAIVGAYGIEQCRALAPRLTGAALLTSFALGTTVTAVYQGARLWRAAETIHADRQSILSAVERPALILVEWHPGYRLNHGWVWSADRMRLRDIHGDVVTYPRPDPAFLETVLSAFPGRHCYYQRRVPPDGELVISACEQVGDLLDDPPAVTGSRWEGLFIVPTANRLGYGATGPEPRDD